jgi:peptide/nickel transport system substrate-binding protein
MATSAHRIIPSFLAALLAAGSAQAADITIGLAAAPSTADPHYHQVTPNNTLARLIFGALARADASLTLQPDLATGWSVSDDRTWKFTLRPDVTFADGAPFTANDVVFSLCRARTGVGPTQSFTNVPKELDRIDVPDPHTIILHTKVPDPLVITHLAGFAIVSAHSAGVGQVSFTKDGDCGIANMPQSSAFDGGPMANGTGPYRLEHYTSGDTIVLARNPRHPGAQAQWDHITLKPVPANGTRVAGLISGDFDLIENPSAQNLPVLKSHGGFAWTVTPSDRVIFLQPDIGREKSPLATSADGGNPLRDPRVRQAISLGIDRAAIASRLLDGLAVPANQYLIPGLFGALTDPAKPVYDPAAARALLAQAGHADDVTLTLSATNDRYINDAQVAQAIGQYLTRIGIHTKVDTMTQTMFFPQRAKRSFSLAMGGWGYSTGEASDLLRYFVVSNLPDRGLGNSNYGAYHSDAFDAAFLPAIQDMNDDKRRSQLQTATEIALHDNALIPLYWETTVWAYKDRYSFTGRIDQVSDPDALRLKGN